MQGGPTQICRGWIPLWLLLINAKEKTWRSQQQDFSLCSSLWWIVLKCGFPYSLSGDILHLSSHWLRHFLVYCDTAANVVMHALSFASILPTLPFSHSCFLWLYSVKHERLHLDSQFQLVCLFIAINVLMCAKVCDSFCSLQNIQEIVSMRLNKKETALSFNF